MLGTLNLLSQPSILHEFHVVVYTVYVSMQGLGFKARLDSSKGRSIGSDKSGIRRLVSILDTHIYMYM